MESEELKKQYYRVYAQVDLDAIEQNMKEMKQRIGTEPALAAVLKADGYGHGAVPIAKKLRHMIKAIALATIDEAINLRKNGIDTDLFLLGFLPEDRAEDALKYHVIPVIFDLKTALILSEQAKKTGMTANIQIKIDTGMGRIGYQVNEDSVKEVVEISKLPNLHIWGAFTHFASSDEQDKGMAREQYRKYMWFIDELAKNGVEIPVKHCNNSAGIIDLPEQSLDLVRAGIALYGLYPSEEVDKEAVSLIPALSLKSRIIYLKELDAGCGISYGSTYITEGKTKIATIPVGYGDGYPRNLSNKGYVLIRGQKAPIVGRVCMDQFMVDVSKIEDVETGDVVTLIGKDGEEQITVEELAALAGTFNYEFVCDLGKRIPRIYISNGTTVCAKDYFDDPYHCQI